VLPIYSLCIHDIDFYICSSSSNWNVGQRPIIKLNDDTIANNFSAAQIAAVVRLPQHPIGSTKCMTSIWQYEKNSSFMITIKFCLNWFYYEQEEEEDGKVLVLLFSVCSADSRDEPVKLSAFRAAKQQLSSLKFIDSKRRQMFLGIHQ